jgi:proline iminopeptidase
VGNGLVPDLVAMSDGCPLWTQATGSGRPVVLCHGGPGLWDYLAPLARLAGPGYRVHRYDQRGCGRSGAKGPWTLDQFISDLDGLRAHFGYQRWIVGGHSFGADLALRYALRYPHRVTGLVYICGTGLEWNLHNSAHKAAARSRRSQREHDRLAALTGHRRGPGEEREYLTLTWAADYADHSLGLAAATEMASVGVPVNYQLSQAGRIQAVCATSSASFSDGVMNPRVLRGLPLRLRAIRAISSAECTDRSVPLGRYWRSRPLMFSFEPRCQGACGSQK